MKLNEDMINDIRNAAKISEVISKYIPIEKKGKNYVALCPFHDDHDPSLSISEDKQIYKCFVCGNGGNVFSFVMNYKNISFPEALEMLAEKSGIELPTDYSETDNIKANRVQYHIKKKDYNENSVEGG